MHEQSCCFADLNIVFLPFSLVSPSLDITRLFQIWSVPAAYEEFAGGLMPIINCELFWMNSICSYNFA